MNRAVVAVALAGSALASLVACREAQEVLPTATTPAPTPSPAIRPSETPQEAGTPAASSPLDCETSLAYPEAGWPQELGQYDAIVLGRVTESQDSAPRRYRVSVLKSYTTKGPEPGSSINVVDLVPDVGQAPCEPTLRERIGEFTPMQASRSYLLFLVANGDGTYGGPFVGRYLVDDCGTLRSLHQPWASDVLGSIPAHKLNDLVDELQKIRAEQGTSQLIENPYASLEALAGADEDIFLGEVLDLSLGPAGETQGAPWRERVYTVAVQQTLVPSTVAPGESLRMVEYWGTDPSLFLQVGATYLFFLDADARGEVASVPLATFAIDECGWVQARFTVPSTAFERLNGQTLQAAEELIESNLPAR